MAAIFQTTFWKGFSGMKISIKNSLKFVPRGAINNIPTLVQVMAWRRPGDKPLSEPMMVRLPTHICVTRPQWVSRRDVHGTIKWYLRIANSPLRLCLFVCNHITYSYVMAWKRLPRCWPFVTAIRSFLDVSRNKRFIKEVEFSMNVMTLI